MMKWLFSGGSVSKFLIQFETWSTIDLNLFSIVAHACTVAKPLQQPINNITDLHHKLQPGKVTKKKFEFIWKHSVRNQVSISAN